jgi:hypothetical protein
MLMHPPQVHHPKGARPRTTKAAHEPPAAPFSALRAAFSAFFCSFFSSFRCRLAARLAARASSSSSRELSPPADAPPRVGGVVGEPRMA